jgi:hypothetical protein
MAKPQAHERVPAALRYAGRRNGRSTAIPTNTQLFLKLVKIREIRVSFLFGLRGFDGLVGRQNNSVGHWRRLNP